MVGLREAVEDGTDGAVAELASKDRPRATGTRALPRRRLPSGTGAHLRISGSEATNPT